MAKQLPVKEKSVGSSPTPSAIHGEASRLATAALSKSAVSCGTLWVQLPLSPPDIGRCRAWAQTGLEPRGACTGRGSIPPPSANEGEIESGKVAG